MQRSIQVLVNYQDADVDSEQLASAIAAALAQFGGKVEVVEITDRPEPAQPLEVVT